MAIAANRVGSAARQGFGRARAFREQVVREPRIEIAANCMEPAWLARFARAP